MFVRWRLSRRSSSVGCILVHGPTTDSSAGRNRSVTCSRRMPPRSRSLVSVLMTSRILSVASARSTQGRSAAVVTRAARRLRGLESKLAGEGAGGSRRCRSPVRQPRACRPLQCKGRRPIRDRPDRVPRRSVVPMVRIGPVLRNGRQCVEHLRRRERRLADPQYGTRH
jgi:hypothetical protein